MEAAGFAYTNDLRLRSFLDGRFVTATLKARGIINLKCAQNTGHYPELCSVRYRLIMIFKPLCGWFVSMFCRVIH